MNERDQVQDDPAYREALAVLERLARAASPVGNTLSPEAAFAEGNQVTDRTSPDRNSLESMAPPSVTTWSESILRNLLESLPDAMVVIDPAGAIVLINKQTEILFG